MKWIDYLDETTKENVQLRIKETYLNEDSLKNAEDPKTAQLWIAIANLSRQVHQISMKVDYLERALQDMHRENMKTTKREELNEIEDAMKKVLRSRKSK